MRPIEFRGKRIDNGQWVYGDLVRVAGGTLCISEPNVCIPRAVQPETVGQYTGRQDKTGHRIYEGDRLGSSCPNGIDPLDGSECDKWEMFEIRDQPVRFDSEFLQYRGTPSTEINSILHSRFISVLGTVHDEETEK